MATINDVEELKVWVRARGLAVLVFKLSGLKPFSRDWELRNQVNAAAGSVMDNIAEGFGRMGNREFINFLLIAHGSLMEVRSQLNRCHDQAFISPVTHDEIMPLTREIGRMIYSMIQYLKKSEKTGQRFR